jgi:hypothetical protein
MIINKYSLKDTSILKGLSIITIVLHNSLHPIYRPFKVCNEFDFSIERIQFFWNSISNNIFATFNSIFMAFGYTGVTLFFFFSAYGLAFKFNKSDSIQYIPFVRDRLIKLYTPIFISAAFLLIFVFTFGKHGSQNNLTPYHFFLQLATLVNYTSSYSAVIVGPWWFLGAIIQLYFVFHLLMWGTKKYGNIFLLIISICSVLTLLIFNDILAQYIFLKKNIIGWLPEVALGIYFVKSDKIDISGLKAFLLSLLCLTIYIIGNIYGFFWYFSSFAILVFSVIISHPILSLVHRYKSIDEFLDYTGKISVYMFLVNGIVREPIIELYSRHDSPVWMHSFCSLIILLLTFITAAVLMIVQEKFIFNKQSQTAG